MSILYCAYIFIEIECADPTVDVYIQSVQYVDVYIQSVQYLFSVVLGVS